jgi:drug/metabolite transporter (DMT)-like permease
MRCFRGAGLGWLGEVLWGWALLGSWLLVGGVMLAIVWGKRSDEAARLGADAWALWVGVGLGLLAALVSVGGHADAQAADEHRH